MLTRDRKPKRLSAIQRLAGRRTTPPEAYRFSHLSVPALSRSRCRAFISGLMAAATLLGTGLALVIPATAAEASVTFTSPPAGLALNNNTSIEPSPVSCGASEPNGPFTFAAGLVGTAEPSTSISLPSGSPTYLYGKHSGHQLGA